MIVTETRPRSDCDSGRLPIIALDGLFSFGFLLLVIGDKPRLDDERTVHFLMVSFRFRRFSGGTLDMYSLG